VPKARPLPVVLHGDERQRARTVFATGARSGSSLASLRGMPRWRGSAARSNPIWFIRDCEIPGGLIMYFAAGVLVVLAGLFYAAGQNQIGSLGSEMCQYGAVFCDNPIYVLVAAALAAVWGAFVSVR
jgi:hypothetical protein